MISFHILCDGQKNEKPDSLCLEIFSKKIISPSATRPAIDAAHLLGWTAKNGRHFCPECSQRMAENA
jgi:hypothetical protein